jgi:cold shock CspA family protein
MDTTQDLPKRYHGTVDWFSRKLGYGFVFSEGERFFFHRKDRQAPFGHQIVTTDDEVDFELGIFNGKSCAKAVKRTVPVANGGAK